MKLRLQNTERKNKMSHIFSKEEIFSQLRALGVPTDKPVTVHTSLRAVGEVEGRGEGFLDILIEYVTADGGLLCIPTHTWHRCGGNGQITLDVRSDDVCIGTLPRIASTYKNVHRTLNPTHSLAIFGDDEKAAAFASLDDSLVSSSDPNGCLGSFTGQNGYILLIGVGQEKNTFLHVVEDMNSVSNRLSNEPYPATVRLEDGSIIEKPLRLIAPRGIGDVSKKYPKLEPAFRLGGAIKYGKIGCADAQLCDAKMLAEIFSGIIKKAGGKELFSDDTPLPEELYKP